MKMENPDFENLYNSAVEEMNAAKSIANFKAVEENFRQLGGFKDSAELAEQCHEKQRHMTYKTALYQVKVGREESLKSAAEKFESIIDYEDSAEQLQKCRERLAAPIKTDFTFVTEIAALISNNDQEVINNLADAIKDPRKYFKKNSKRFRVHDMEIDDYVFTKKEAFNYSRSMDEVLWVAMIDELNAGGYLLEVDSDCEIEDFIEELKWIKAYDLLSEFIPEQVDIDWDAFYGLECLFGKIDLDDDDDDVWGVDLWCMQLNTVLDGKAIVGYVDSSLDIELYPLIIVTPEVLAKVCEIAGENGHKFLSLCD
ncbi:MAG: hypothetical protein K2N06_02125 [Oscillospiraceae bacterium]|nr:hypothetical protein [Oscillospiraceae bacterium]